MATDPTNPNPASSDPFPSNPMHSTEGGSPRNNQPTSRRNLLSRRALTGVAVIALLAIGAAVGAVAMSHGHGWRTATYAPLPPVAISAMTDWSTVEVKGQVAEIFGNKFVLQDQSGRTLVETGRQGEDGNLVAKDEAVTVQGRFEHGFVHAAFIVHSDGKTVALDPPHGPPPHGPLDWLRDHRVEATPPRVLTPPAA